MNIHGLRLGVEEFAIVLWLLFHPKEVFCQFSSLFLSTWYQSMQKMTTESQSFGSFMGVIKVMISKSYDKSNFLLNPISDEQGTSSHTERN